MKTFFISTLFLLFAVNITAQTDYPQKIEAGTSKSVTARQYDLWIITANQMDSAIATGLRYRVCDSIYRSQILKIEKLEKINMNLSAVNDTLEKAYIRYSGKWKTCDINLEKAEKNLVKQKRLKYLFGGGGFAAGLLFALLIF